MECIPGRYKKKDLHQLRVRIKRLKSIFFLLEYIYPSNFGAKDYYSLFKPVFKSAGLMREVQINSDLLKKFVGTDELQKAYNEYIGMIWPGMAEDLERSIAGFNHSQLDIISSRVEQLLGKHEEAGLVDLITGFISYETGRITYLTDDLTKTEYIHDIRIMLKNIKPLLLLVYPVSYSVFSEAHYRQLNDTETSIGKWHDLQVLSVSLSLFSDAVENKNSGISQEYGSLNKKLETKKRKAFNMAQKSIAETLLFFNQGPSAV
ncbi:MAG: CHAD domain-containing protein [Bacteroidales bacterium]|nr:CHAD domain-containing protein [Bacteroidales bacterium]